MSAKPLVAVIATTLVLSAGQLAARGEFETRLDPPSEEVPEEPVPEVIQPDNRVGKRLKGDNIYNSTGKGQSQRLTLQVWQSVRYGFAVQNDGNVTDSFNVSATKKNRFFYVTYMLGKKNVTAAITGKGRLHLANLEPQEMRKLSAKVSRNRGYSRKKGYKKTFRVMSSSDALPTKRDMIKTTVKSNR